MRPLEVERGGRSFLQDRWDRLGKSTRDQVAPTVGGPEPAAVGGGDDGGAGVGGGDGDEIGVAAGAVTRMKRTPSVVTSTSPSLPANQQTVPPGEEPAVMASAGDRQRGGGEGGVGPRRELDALRRRGASARRRRPRRSSAPATGASAPRSRAFVAQQLDRARRAASWRAAGRGRRPAPAPVDG